MQIHDILVVALSKWVSNTAHILSDLFDLHPGNVVKSRLCSSPFFTVLNTLFLIVRLIYMVTLTGFWCRLSNNLLLACHRLQPLLGMAKPGPRLGSGFNVQKQYVLDSGGVLPTKNTHIETKYESCQNGRKSSIPVSAHSTDSQKRENHGGWYFWRSAVFYFINISSPVVQVGTLACFLDQQQNIIFNRLVSNIVKCDSGELPHCPMYMGELPETWLGQASTCRG